jgi:hypothetical protein
VSREEGEGEKGGKREKVRKRRLEKGGRVERKEIK